MDISIKNLKKHVFEPKTESLRIARAKDIISANMIVTEKVDGTKLTLVRRNNPASPDYTKNWIVAYKGAILSAKEFSHLGDKEKEDIAGSSVGIGQYALVFDHLKKINDKIGSIPLSTEFSVEFAQNKDTLTRTYTNKGGMFLRSYGKVVYRIVQGELHTAVQGAEITAHDMVKKMADYLEISSFPIFHRGNLTQASLMKNPLLAPKLTNVDWNNPLDVLTKFSAAVLAIPSSLGGTTEGVVMKLPSGEFFKLVQDDQYDATTRDAKKAAYKLGPEAATAYFQQIRALINNVFNIVGTGGKSEVDIVSDVNFYIAKHGTELKKFFDSLEKIAAGKKNLVQINDDIHDTVRLLVAKGALMGHTARSLGLIPIAGKPVHLGHWKLIEKAAAENDAVVVYTSSSDRIKKGEYPIKGDDFVRIWSDILIPALPKNVKVKFVDSPVRSTMHELGWLEQLVVQDRAKVPTVNLYSDAADVELNFKDEDLKKYPYLLSVGKVKKVGVERTSTVNISGTKMREFLRDDEKAQFLKYLPPVSAANKEEIWTTLTKDNPITVEEIEIPEFLQGLVQELSEALDKRRDLFEGGWRTKETQKTVITPPKVAKIESAMEEFVSAFNRYSKLPPISTNGPVGSAMYYKQDMNDKTVSYGDVDIQLVLPVETNNRDEQLNSNKLYAAKVREFIEKTKPSYISPNLKDAEFGGAYLVFIIDNEKLQVDLVMSHKASASWTKVRTTPERGLKGFVTGTLFSALSAGLNVVLGASTNPYINTVGGVPINALTKKGAVPVFLKPDEIFLEILKFYAKLSGVKKVNAAALQGHYGLDKNDPSMKKKCQTVVALADALEANGIFAKDVIISKNGVHLNSRNKFVRYVLDTFIKALELSVTSKKFDKAETPEAMKNIEKAKAHASIGAALAKQIIREEIELLNESGMSVAAVDPKTPKTVNGQPAQASTKLKIVGADGKDVHSSVSADVKEVVYALNAKVGFWKKNNPYIENGFIFNGSSHYLMDPKKFGVLSKYKDSFGDIDVIIPKQKLDTLEQFLDSCDDSQATWTPTPKNKIGKNFYYVGRTKSYASIPDQLVTLWYYVPAKQVVQIDFEGDEMVLDPQGYEKPSEWTKFSKDSPWDDLTMGIKGLAGALMLRSLARAATVLPNAVVLTPGAVKRVQAGATELGPKDVTIAAQHTVPSAYTLNTGGGGTGIRKAYQLVKKDMLFNGKKVDAYRFVEATETKPEDRITDVGRIFEILFKKPAGPEERASFRSFQGLLKLMKKYLDKPAINLAMKRFVEILAGEPLAPKEKAAIQKAVKEILGISI